MSDNTTILGSEEAMHKSRKPLIGAVIAAAVVVAAGGIWWGVTAHAEAQARSAYTVAQTAEQDAQAALIKALTAGEAEQTDCETLVADTATCDALTVAVEGGKALKPVATVKADNASKNVLVSATSDATTNTSKITKATTTLTKATTAVTEAKTAKLVADGQVALSGAVSAAETQTPPNENRTLTRH